MEIKKFYYIEFKGGFLPISGLFKCGARPLIWNNRGMCGIISKEKVENMMQRIKDNESLSSLNTVWEAKFYWDEVEVIDPKVAKLLFKAI